MKKIYIILWVALILCFASCVHAADFAIVKSPQTVRVNGTTMEFEVYNIDGNNFFKLRDIAYVLNGTSSQFSVEYNEENRRIEAKTSSPYVANGNEMKTGIDNSATAVRSSQNIQINDAMKELLAYNIGGNNFFKLRDLGVELNFLVDYEETTNTVIVQSKDNNPITNIVSVTVKEWNGITYVEVISDSPLLQYSDFTLSDSEKYRIVIDMAHSKLAFENRIVEAHQGGLAQIRIGVQEGNVNRLVLDMESNMPYIIQQSLDKKTTCIALSSSFDFFAQETNPIVPENSGESLVILESGDNIIIPVDENISGETREEEPVEISYTKEQLKNRIKISSIKYSSTNDTIKVTGSSTFDYTEELSENPYQLIIDMHNAVLDVEGPTEIKPKNKMITGISFSQEDEMTVRLVIEADMSIEHTMVEKNNVLQIGFDEPTYYNVTYHSNEDGAKIVLKDVEKDIFTIKEDKEAFKYTVKYSESRFSCGTGTITIEDDFVKNIKISTGRIILQGKEDATFTMEQKGKDTVITIKLEDIVTVTPTKEDNTTKETTTISPTASKNGFVNTIQRTSKFAVSQINDTRFRVGNVMVNNSSGLTVDLNALKTKSNLRINQNTDVLIYHTHTTEGYVETGKDSNFHTTNNDLNVVAVGETLKDYLELKGIQVLHDTTRNDINYNYSYDTSLENTSKLVAKQPYDVIIDLHRDAISSDLYYGPKTTINGESCAKLMFVLGTNANYEHPNWMENLKAAILIQNKAEEMYPGLFRDISLTKYRYNLHLSNGSFIIEVGATGNTMQEVKNSMKYLANVLAALDS